MKQTELDIEGLEKRRTSLVAKPDVAAAQARLQDAQAALALALKRQEQSVLRAPMSGVVYDLAARPGAYLETGALVANVGQLDRLRVRVYVDEPELGRVQPGQPVTIRWQALPGKEWHGIVERKPAAIQALGSREVGEVVCTIENPGRELIPGTNVDAEIRTAVAENALVVPREALRHDAAGDYVLAVKDGVIERRPVDTGISNVTQVQIVFGLADGDAVVAAHRNPAPARPARHPAAFVEPAFSRPCRHSCRHMSVPRARSPYDPSFAAPPKLPLQAPDVHWFFHVCFRLPLRRGRGPIRLVSRPHRLSLVRPERGEHGLDVRHHGPAAFQPGPQAGHAGTPGRTRQRRRSWPSRPATPPPSS